MEKTRKILTLLTILVMALCMSTTVFAAGEGTITIGNAVVDQTYNAYRIFDLESYNTATNSYSYTVNPAWANFFKEGAEGLNYVTMENGYVTWKDQAEMDKTAEAAAFAKAAMAYATENNIAPVKTETAAADGTLAMTGLNLGYYLVDSTVGTLCELTTTKPTIEITDKELIKKLVNGVKLNKNEIMIDEKDNFFIKIENQLVGMYHFEGEKLICDVFLFD